METIYYTLDAKRLTVTTAAKEQAACGGQESICYAFVPRAGRRPASGGKIIHFADYLPVETDARSPAPDRPEEPPAPARKKRLGFALVVDLWASAAIVAMLAVLLIKL